MNLKTKLSVLAISLSVSASLLMGMPNTYAAGENVFNSSYVDHGATNYAQEVSSLLADAVASKNKTIDVAFNIYNKATKDKMELLEWTIKEEKGKNALYAQSYGMPKTLQGYIDYHTNTMYMPSYTNGNERVLYAFNVEEVLAKHNPAKLEEYKKKAVESFKDSTPMERQAIQDKITKFLNENIDSVQVLKDNREDRVYMFTTKPQVLATLHGDMQGNMQDLYTKLKAAGILDKPHTFKLFVKVDKEDQQIEEVKVDITELMQEIIKSEKSNDIKALQGLGGIPLKALLPVLDFELELDFDDMGTTKLNLPKNVKVIKGFAKIPAGEKTRILASIVR